MSKHLNLRFVKSISISHPFIVHLTALSRVLPACHRIRENASINVIYNSPFTRPVPAPEKVPIRILLVRVKLSFDEASHLLLGIGIPLILRRALALAPVLAARSARDGTAIRQEAGVGNDAPLPNVDGHILLCGLERCAPATGLGDVLRLIQGIIGVCVERVVVNVYSERATRASIAVERLCDAIELVWSLERVMRDDDKVLVLDDGFDGLEA